MRSDKDRGEFFLKLNHKPHVRELIERLDELTDNDIDNLSEPKWVRDGLKAAKQHQSQIQSNIRAHKIAQDMIDNSIPKNIDSMVEVYEWQGPTEFWRCGTLGNMSMEIRTQDLFGVWVYENDVYWRIDSSQGCYHPAEWMRVKQQSTHQGLMSWSEFVKFKNMKLSGYSAPTQTSMGYTGTISSTIKPNGNREIRFA